MRMLAMPLLLAVSLTTAGASEVVRTIAEEFDASGLATVSIDFPVGEVEISPSDSGKVELELMLECSGWRSSSCRDRAERIEVDSDRRGDRLSVEIEGYSTWRSRGLKMHLQLRLPARAAVSLDMGIGEVSIRDLHSDVAVDLGIGEVTVRMDEAYVGRVILDSGIGETSLRTRESRNSSAGLFSSEVSWDDGPGKATIRVDLGIGEIDVRIE